MKKLTETQFTKEFRKELKLKGWLIFKINERFSSGFPDLLCIRNGVIKFIENKSDENDLTKLQDFTLEEIKKYGGNVSIVDFKSQIEKGDPIEYEEFTLSDYKEIKRNQLHRKKGNLK